MLIQAVYIEYGDKKTPDKASRASLPWFCNNGMGLNCLHSDAWTCHLWKRIEPGTSIHTWDSTRITTNVVDSPALGPDILTKNMRGKPAQKWKPIFFDEAACSD
ncbi:hypothetical protein AVEN_109061-1 [Araneus ventricosus]|uniref:Uncharacterized protein n=1 Tax=Araneus ventricosus TaxID=182803 RepID=A0A4Y2JY36_ARAVE|nr:hypothetical protein AVEN_109061-1 [Araneus ventricosus]